MCTKYVQLVKSIEKFPCLYNYNLTEYLKKESSDKAWLEVANQTEMSVSECKEKWKNLRYGLLRSLRLNSDGTLKRKYYLYDEMAFVLPFIRTSKHHESALHQLEVDTDEEIAILNNQNMDNTLFHYEETDLPEPPNKKTKTAEIIKYLEQSEQDDSRKMFLLSLLPEVNALSEYQMRIFRRKMLQLLDEVSDSPSQYEISELKWQKDSFNQEVIKSTSPQNVIKKEPV